ncbi:YncE family protein [Pediococcus claussenii]|uniref:Uncharacterized protein n=1 Tax=Pediococcus claussenii (strain ATCC BAA-344 / DSM 14800 / JCM 18046 / KCTC 3811 / LMG 21948 / P06) TaxID=701521 RepID=G8PBM9_PEDCP|nr:hypothetical protein [Pediococcus claussenii]AEV94778.1 hypothetical protein PECL_476 [Pediococcus claussenii ATCC BAA-344]ANZ69975.1 hypothetical protein AYR57_06455 [Pediococcus claussenii]ANZ71791.1 hypothetical protein AYR58_06455 [Pediococcus claussenii]KRN20957.1 hypothetical protein IV79_GL000182 [Pediococcus claussenii]
MKKIITFVFLFFLVAGGIYLGSKYLGDKNEYSSMVAKKNNVPRWTSDSKALISEKQFNTIFLSANKKSAGNNGIGISEFPNISSTVIPGLRGGWSINKKTKKSAFGTDWVPQGITQTPNYIFISEYDGNHKLNSLIQVVNIKTGQYVKTLILNSASHVGGLAYDPVRKILWWSDDLHGYGGLAYTSISTVDNYNAQMLKRPIKSNYKILPWVSKTSGIVYYKNQLVVVIYGQKRSSRSVIAMPLNKKTGMLKDFVSVVKHNELNLKSEKELVKSLIKSGLVQSMTKGWPRMQGLSINDKGFSLFSQSNGLANSKIWFEEPNDKTGTAFAFNPPKEKVVQVTTPPSIEQTSLSTKNQSLLVLFESGAREYREAGNFLYRQPIMDRVVRLQLSKN